jgi:hypothetical protein
MLKLKRWVPESTKFSAFDYCVLACRTSLQSTQSENSYRGAHSYCYGVSKPPLETLPVNSDWSGLIKD